MIDVSAEKAALGDREKRDRVWHSLSCKRQGMRRSYKPHERDNSKIETLCTNS